MTAKRIQQVALVHFAQYGYAETSMAMIAEEVGIKKPSIYAHYKSKEDLYLHVVQSVFQTELASIMELAKAQQDKTLKQFLPMLLNWYMDQYNTRPEMKFMLRTSFFPPAAVEEEVMERLYIFLDTLEQYLGTRIATAVRTGEIVNDSPEQVATAFMCLLDGICVELLYGGQERATRKLEAAWNVFWKGLT